MSSKNISRNAPFVGVQSSESSDFTDGRFDSFLALEGEYEWEVVRSRRQTKSPSTLGSAATLPVTGMEAKLQRAREKAERRARLVRGTSGPNGQAALEEKTKQYMKKVAIKALAAEDQRLSSIPSQRRPIEWENEWARGPPPSLSLLRTSPEAALEEVVDVLDERNTEELVAEELGFSMSETAEEKAVRRDTVLSRSLANVKRDKKLREALERERKKVQRLSSTPAQISASVRASTMRRLTNQAARVREQLKDKTDYLSANLPAETLLNEKSWTTASVGELKRMSSQAQIFKSSWRQKKDPPKASIALANWIRSDLPSSRAGVVTRADHNSVLHRIKDKRLRGVLNRLWTRIESDSKYDVADRAQYFAIVDEAITKHEGAMGWQHQGQTDSKLHNPNMCEVRVKGIPVEVDVREALFAAVPQLQTLAELAPTAARVVQGIVSVAALAIAIGDSTTWDGACASMVLFYQANSDLVSLAGKKFFDAAISKIKTGFHHQAADDVMPSDVVYQELDDLVTRNTIVYSLWDVFSCLSISSVVSHFGLKYLGWESSPSYLTWVRTFLRERTTADTFFSKLVSFFKTIVERVSAAVKSGDWHELFKASRTPEHFVEESLCLLECEVLRLDLARPRALDLFNTMRKNGQIPRRFTAQLSDYERRELCHDLAEEGASHAKNLSASPIPPIYLINSITRIVERLRIEVYNLDNIKLNGQMRREPFSVFIHGVPGCGKSRMLGPMSFALGHAKGLPTGPETRYSVVPNANFYDGYNNQWCLVMDDIDQSPGKPAYGDVTHADVVRELINSKSTQLEQADVDVKGKKFANFLASFYMTNFADGRIEHAVLPPAVMAHWRRFHYYIHMKVNPLVATETGRLKTVMEGLREAAGDLSEDEYWIFDVYNHDDSKYDPTNPHTSRPFALKETYTSRSALMAWMTAEFIRHHQEQDAELSPVDESQVCNICHLPVQLHKNCAPCTSKLQAGETLTTEEQECAEAFRALPQVVEDSLPSLTWRDRLWVAGDYMSNTLRRVFRVVDVKGTVSGWKSKVLARVVDARIRARARLEEVADRAVAYKGDAKLSVETRMALVNVQVERIKGELKEHSEKARTYLQRKWEENKVALGVGAVIVAMSAPLVAFAYTRAKANRDARVRLQAYTTEGIDPTPFKLEQRAVRYNRVEIDRAAFIPTSPTMSFAQLIAVAAANTVRIVVQDTSSTVWGVVWRPGEVVTVKHAFFPPEVRNMDTFDVRVTDIPVGRTFTLAVTAKGMNTPYATRVATSEDRASLRGVLGRDLAVFSCPGIITTTGAGLRPYTQKTSVRPVTHQFDKASLVTQATERTAWTAYYKPGYCKISREPSIHFEMETFEGDCGAPLIAQAGKWIAVVGLHGSGFVDDQGNHVLGQAEELVAIEVDSVRVDTFEVEVKGFSFQSGLLRRGGGDLTFKPLPEKSSLWAAIGRMEAPIQVCGTIFPPLPLSSNRTRIYRTPMAPAFASMEEEYAGPVPAFHAPEFGGRMIGEGPNAHWRDPFTISLENMRNESGSAAAWTWALEDYLEGVEELPGWDRVRPLTDYEAWAGIPGAVKSTAMATSTGAPFFRKKREMIAVVQGSHVDVDSEIAAHIDALEAEMRRGNVVVIPCWHTLKDEEVSSKKKEAGQVRVFNTVGASFNLLAKKYLAPLAQVVHANRDFFESAIGMDLTSDEVYQFVRALERFGPDGIAAGDFEKYDWRTCTAVSLAKARVWRRLAKCAGYSPEDCDLVYFIGLSCMYTMRVIKNDVFLCAFSMASGMLETGDGNGFTNSLSHRYSWYRFWEKKGCQPPPFRKGVALRVLGDDNARGVAEWAREWTIEESAKTLREIGHTLTPATKEGAFQDYGSIKEITFMKRSFVERELTHSTGYTRKEWVAPLERKSIVKQVVMGMRSELSEFDYHATLLSNAAREAFLHGEEFYTRYVEAALEAARLARVTRNAALVLPSYQFWADQYLEKRFRLWDPENNPTKEFVL